MSRVVGWFSAGAASAVAMKLMLSQHPRGETIIARIVIPSEHPDNNRFAADCEKWFDHPITNLASTRYRDTWDVWERRRFLVGPKGALCTTELKKMVRNEFERVTDIQVYGYTVEERDRAQRFRQQNFEVQLETPLIAAGLTKADCLAMVQRAGIEIPAMYRLGFSNNNCIGCVKGGAGYWNKIRRDFPGVFARMAKLERHLGHTVVKVGEDRVFLDELPSDAGRHDEPSIDCSLLCVIAEQEIAQ